MKYPYFRIFLITLFTMTYTHAAEPVQELKTVTVTADELADTTEGTDSYTTGAMKTATKLDMSIHETPQSVSVVTRTQMDDFQLSGISDVLESTTGVTVEQIETDRVYYTARGFEITNFQQDGVGIPLTDTIAYGNPDTAIYDRVEVVRGASGLISGAGNPSATINLVRKRPTDSFQASVKASTGSWDNYRLDADVAGPVSENIRGRLVLANQTKQSYLDNYSQDKFVMYGVGDVKLSDSTVLTAGASREDTRSNSPMWGALPLVYSDNSETDYATSTSTSADWSFWDTQNDNLFVEVVHQLNQDWELTTVYRRVGHEDTSELFYVFGTPDVVTEAGLFGWPGRYETTLDQDILNAYLVGKFGLGGRQHDVVAGLSYSEADQQQDEMTDPAYGFPPIGNLKQWDGHIARPNFNVPGSGSDFSDEEKSIYAAGRFMLQDALSFIVGARVVNWESEGESYDVPENAKETGNVIPYTGLVYDIDDAWSVYASYTETFMPQGERDLTLQRLDPTEGNSKEAGVKSSWFDNKLNATFAVFDAKHEGLATWVGYVGIEAVYAPEDFYSSGYELEVAGELAPGLEGSIGYTQLVVEDKNGSDARKYIPKELLRTSLSYRLPFVRKTKIGVSVDWQDAIERTDGLYKQEDYALLDAFLSCDFSKHVSAAVNLNNMTNEKYINSLNWDQGYYGSPRNIMASATYKF